MPPWFIQIFYGMLLIGTNSALGLGANPNSNSPDVENINSHLVRLAENISQKYYIGSSKGCIVLITQPGYLEDFYIPGSAFFRISSEDFCNDDEAINRMVTVFDEMCYKYVDTERVKPTCLL